MLQSESHNIDFIWNKEELSEQGKESIVVQVHKKSDKTDCSNIEACHCCRVHTNFYQIFSHR
jgi:hypothetical protein